MGNSLRVILIEIRHKMIFSSFFLSTSLMNGCISNILCRKIIFGKNIGKIDYLGISFEHTIKIMFTGVLNSFIAITVEVGHCLEFANISMVALECASPTSFAIYSGAVRV